MNVSRTILLVEDQALLAMDEESVISGYGFNVIKASSGRKAIQAVMDNGEISLILMDIDLGKGMDGTKAAEEILKIRELPIVFLTSHSEKQMVEKVRNITRYGYVLKNTGEFVLIESIQMAYELFNARQELKKDIEQRKSIEEILRQSENLFRAMVENGSDAITLVGSDGGIIYEGPTVGRMTGFEPAKRIGKSGFDNIYPEDLPKVKAAFEEVASMPGKSINLQFRSVKADGTVWWTDGSAVNRTNDPDIRSIIVNYRDITEKKKAEDALKNSEEKFRNIFENSSTGSALVSLEGKYLLVNPALCGIFGYSKEELLSADFFNITHPDDIEMSERIMKKVIEGGGEKVSFTKRYLHKDGHIIWADVNSALVYNEMNKPSYFVTHVADITERIHMENALKESEEKFRTAFEHANTSMCLVDLNGNFFRVNNKMCSIFGYARDELENMNFKTITAPEDIRISSDFINKSIAGEMQSASIEKRYLHKDGHIIWCLLSSTLLRNVRGEPQYFISQILDINERKKAEREIQKLLEEREMILHEVHHRIKNDMNVISSLLSVEASSSDNPLIKKTLKEAQSRIHVMFNVYNELYKGTDFNSIPLKIFITDLLNNIRNIYHPSSGVQYKLDISNISIPRKISFSIGIIVNEAVSNACKYAFQNDEKNRIITVSITPNQNKIKIKVKDNGKGFPEDILSEKKRGFGLKLIEMLSGNIGGKPSFTNRNGAVFEVEIPVSE